MGNKKRKRTAQYHIKRMQEQAKNELHKELNCKICQKEFIRTLSEIP